MDRAYAKTVLQIRKPVCPAPCIQQRFVASLQKKEAVIQFLTVSGVGNIKAQRYGDAFLEVLNQQHE